MGKNQNETIGMSLSSTSTLDSVLVSYGDCCGDTGSLKWSVSPTSYWVNTLSTPEAIQNSGSGSSSTNYPPYNIVQKDFENYYIEIAVAGFKRSEIDVEVQGRLLTITGKVTASDSDLKYHHRGLARRAFTLPFTLAEDARVDAVMLDDGILTIDLLRVVEEKDKPRKLQIL